MTKCATRDLLRAVLPVLSKKPAASMDEIADAVHLGRATLFRRFGSRDGLIRALMLESYAIGREIMEPLLTMRAPAEERLALAVAGLVPAGLPFGFLLNEAWREDDPELARADAAYRRAWEELLTAWRAEGGMGDGIPLAWAARCIDMLICSAWAGVDAGEVALNDAPALVLRAVHGGLGAGAEAGR